MTSIGTASLLAAASLQATDLLAVERPGVTTPYRTTLSSLSLAATGAINVKDYGAVGDGTTDDTAAIQAAIDAANAAWSSTAWTSVPVIIPGSFSVADLILKSGVVLTGGPGRSPTSRLYGLPGATWVVDTPATAIEKAGIEHLSIQGPSDWTSNGMAGVRIQNGVRVKIDTVYFNGFENQAIVMGGIANHIRDCFVQNTLRNRTRASQCGGIEITGTDHYLEKTEVTVGYTGLTEVSSANLYCAAWYINGGNCFIDGCIGEISDVGFHFGPLASFGMIVNTRADLNYGHGFYLVNGSSNLQFANCLALNNSQDTDNTYDGFHYAGNNGGEFQFSNCNSYSRSPITNCHRYGFYSGASSGSLNTIFNNCLSGGQKTGAIYLNAFYPSLFSVPSGSAAIAFTDGDATPSVAPFGMPLDSFTIDNTDPTTITNFDDGINGQVIWIVSFKTTTTIEHNSNIQTLSGSDISCANGQALCFKKRNTVWFQF